MKGWHGESLRHSLASRGIPTTHSNGFDDEPENLDDFLSETLKISSKNTFTREEELELADQTSENDRISLEEIGFNIHRENDDLCRSEIVEGEGDEVLIPYEDGMNGTFHVHPIGMPNPSTEDLQAYFNNDFDCAIIGSSLPSSEVVIYFEIPDSVPEEEILEDFDYGGQEDEIIDEINLRAGDEKIDVPVYTKEYMEERFEECMDLLNDHFNNVDIRRSKYD